MLKWVPALLVAFRVVAAPGIAWLLMQHQASIAGWLYIAAVISDIYDGVIARRLGIATLRLRQADGIADVWLFLCLLAGLWGVYRSLIVPLAWPFGISMVLQVASWIFCFWRFGKMTSYHSFLSKLTGLVLLLGILALLFAETPIPLEVALWIFVLSLLEEIAMTTVLRRYHHDVWNLAAALRLRREEAPTTGN